MNVVSKLIVCVLICGLAFLPTGDADAGLIPNAISGVTSTGHHQSDSFDGNGSVRTAVDGTGLTVVNPYDSSTWTHSNAWADDWQGNLTGGTTVSDGWMVMDLGSVVDNLDTMTIWNVNENNATARGTQTFDLYYATSPTVTPPVQSTTTTTYDFSSGGWTKLDTSPIAIRQGGTSISGIVNLCGVSSAQYLGLDILTDYGWGRPGFAEVQVTTSGEPYNVFVPNSQFDRLDDGRPITSKQNNLDNVLAWDGGGGVETSVHAFVSPQQSIYTYLPETIALGDTWTLDASSYMGWPPPTADDMEARLFWYGDDGQRHTIVSQAYTSAGPMNVSFTATEGEAYLGKNIGIEFFSPMSAGNWSQVDDLLLTLDPGPLQYTPITVGNPGFENGTELWGFSGGGTTPNDGATEGTDAAWFGANFGAWQGTGEIILDSSMYRLLLDTHQTGGLSNNPELTASLFYYSPGDDLSDPANRIALETLIESELTPDFQTIEILFLGDGVGVGKLLGIEFFNTGNGWLGVDNVRLSSAVPEPTTYAITLIGFCGLLGARWRRKRSYRKDPPGDN